MLAILLMGWRSSSDPVKANAYKHFGKASHMPQGTNAEQLYKQLSSAGAKLIAALADEASMAVLSHKHPDDEELYLKWAHARQVTEECQEAYYQWLILMARPIMPGSPPKRRFQRPLVRTATRGAPGRSSSGEKVRPITGVTPSMRK